MIHRQEIVDCKSDCIRIVKEFGDNGVLECETLYFDDGMTQIRAFSRGGAKILEEVRSRGGALFRTRFDDEGRKLVKETYATSGELLERVYIFYFPDSSGFEMRWYHRGYKRYKTRFGIVNGMRLRFTASDKPSADELKNREEIRSELSGDERSLWYLEFDESEEE